MPFLLLRLVAMSSLVTFADLAQTKSPLRFFLTNSVAGVHEAVAVSQPEETDDDPMSSSESSAQLDVCMSN